MAAVIGQISAFLLYIVVYLRKTRGYDSSQISASGLAADPSDILGWNPVFSDDDDAVCSGGVD